MYPTCTKINDNEFVLYGGRTSPYNPVNSKPWFCKVNWNQEKRSCAIVPVEVVGYFRNLFKLFFAKTILDFGLNSVQFSGDI